MNLSYGGQGRKGHEEERTEGAEEERTEGAVKMLEIFRTKTGKKIAYDKFRMGPRQFLSSRRSNI